MEQIPPALSPHVRRGARTRACRVETSGLPIRSGRLDARCSVPPRPASSVPLTVRSGTLLRCFDLLAYAVGMTSFSWKRTVIALLLFGTAFGYLEAAVVSYLRQLHEPARQRFHPGRPPADLFPLLTLAQLREGNIQPLTLPIEVGREAATILMLAAVALAVEIGRAHV